MAHPNVIIKGVTYSNCEEVNIPIVGGGTAEYFDASQTDVVAANVLDGIRFVGASGEDVGTMPNNGATGGTIGTKAGTYSIPSGCTSGGVVSLTNVSDCTAANIVEGKSILGVNGTAKIPSISYADGVLSIS